MATLSPQQQKVKPNHHARHEWNNCHHCRPRQQIKWTPFAFKWALLLLFWFYLYDAIKRAVEYLDKNWLSIVSLHIDMQNSIFERWALLAHRFFFWRDYWIERFDEWTIQTCIINLVAGMYLKHYYYAQFPRWWKKRPESEKICTFRLEVTCFWMPQRAWDWVKHFSSIYSV